MPASAALGPSHSSPAFARTAGQKSNGVTQSNKATLSPPYPNPSLQVTADHNLKQVEAPVYAPAPGEVLLHIKATGVCGYVPYWSTITGIYILTVA